MRRTLSSRLFRVFAAVLIALLSCTGKSGSAEQSQTSFCLHSPFSFKSADPDPVLISDYNILIYNCFGMLEESVYVPEREMASGAEFTTTLLSGGDYTVLVAANLGYELAAPAELADALQITHYLAYPDEYSHGIPMAAVKEHVPAGRTVDVRLERLMAAIDIGLDKSLLDPDVQMTPVEVRIGKCPRAARLFSPGKAERFFANGFVRTGRELDELIRGGTVRLYMLENLSGENPSSYIEIKTAYHGASGHSKPGEYLIYRFFLGGEGSFDIARNTLYRILVQPVGDGLSCEDGWRVDRGGLD